MIKFILGLKVFVTVCLESPESVVIAVRIDGYSSLSRVVSHVITASTPCWMTQTVCSLISPMPLPVSIS